MTATSTRTVAVVTAGLSQPSSTRLLGEQLAAAVSRCYPGDVEIVHVELRELAHDVVNNLLTGFPSPALATAIEPVTSADAVIAVSPIFSASYSGLFKSFFDVLNPEALTGTPVLIGATGGSARHSLALEYALRPLFAYLRADVIPTGVFAATPDWGSASAGSSSNTGSDLAERIERAGRQLAEALERAPERGPAPAVVVKANGSADPFARPTSFLQLLGKN